jgi:uncharacterized repeat protein (TIGR01451 family)
MHTIRKRISGILGLLLSLSPCLARAQAPAPLLGVRILGPEGMHVAFFQGHAPPRDFPAPVTVGLRPGYVHRIRLTGLPERPGVTLAPTLEVVGTVCMPPKLAGADHPAPLVITEQDIEHVLSGAYLTKIVYLEDPDKAVPVAGKPDQPLEMEVPPDRDLMNEARNLGRPLLIVRLGQREVAPEELAHGSIPETILFPGQRTLLPPPLPPCLPFAGIRLYDPVLGPKPCTEECLHDGGDAGLPLGIGPDGKLNGLDPADTAAVYTDASGHRHVTTSNRVCLCVPRFALVKNEVPLAGFDGSVGLLDTRGVEGRDQLVRRQPSGEANQREQLAAVRGRKQAGGTIATVGTAVKVQVYVLNAERLTQGTAEVLAVERLDRLTQLERLRLQRGIEFAQELNAGKGVAKVEQLEGTAVVGRVEGLKQLTSAVATLDLTMCCCECPRVPDAPLTLCKWADAQCAQIGDVVTFYLKYSNHGGRAITDVAVSDSLTTRLEYVPGSAKADRDAVFTLEQNEAGSATLRWEIGGRLLPGQSGLVSFQARVR